MGTAPPNRRSTPSRRPCRCCATSSAPIPSTAEPGRDLAEEERAIVDAVARWDDREVRPHAGRLKRRQRYPAALIEQMKAMGVLGRAGS
ncbi:MAG TPA: acyl-CoA dehydrogenase family protein [Modestobacter sp.]|nr:acyl-CoA dehydrogenase family protein [Modestobacter sp.]